MDPIYCESLSSERRTRKYCEVCDHFCDHSDKTDPEYQRTIAEKRSFLEWRENRKRRKIWTRRKSQTGPRRRFCAQLKGNILTLEVPPCEVRNNRNTQRKNHETKSKHTQQRIGRHGTANLPPPGHVVTGDGTNDDHRSSLFRQSSFFFFSKCLCDSRDPAS